MSSGNTRPRHALAALVEIKGQAAVNDGRIKIGVEGLTGLNAKFSAALMHEMTIPSSGQ
jgi:hypothetical protein